MCFPSLEDLRFPRMEAVENNAAGFLVGTAGEIVLERALTIVLD